MRLAAAVLLLALGTTSCGRPRVTFRETGRTVTAGCDDRAVQSGVWQDGMLERFAVAAVRDAGLAARDSTAMDIASAFDRGDMAAVESGVIRYACTFGVPSLHRTLAFPDSGSTPPEFQLPRVTVGAEAAGSVRLSDYHGRVVAITFGGSWCVPCKSEMRELEAAARAWSSRGLDVLAVVFNESDSSAAAWRAADAPTVTFALDRDNAVAERYRIRAAPALYVLDRAGRLVSGGSGYMPGHAARLLDSLLSRL